MVEIASVTGSADASFVESPAEGVLQLFALDDAASATDHIAWEAASACSCGIEIVLAVGVDRNAAIVGGSKVEPVGTGYTHIVLISYAVWISVLHTISVGVGVSICVGVDISVSIGIGVSVSVSVSVNVSVGICVGVSVDVGSSSTDLTGSIDHRVSINARNANARD